MSVPAKFGDDVQVQPIDVPKNFGSIPLDSDASPSPPPASSPMGLRDTAIHAFDPLSEEKKANLTARLGKVGGNLAAAFANTGLGVGQGIENTFYHPLSAIFNTAQQAIDVLNQTTPDSMLSAQGVAEKQAGIKRLKDQWKSIKDNPDFSLGNILGTILTAHAAGETIGPVTRGLKDTVAKARSKVLDTVTNTGPKVTAELAKDTQKANDAESARAADTNTAAEAKRQADLREHFEKTQKVKQANAEAEAEPARKEALARGVERLDTEFQNDLKQTAKDVKTKADEKYATVRAALNPQPKPVDYIKNGRDVNLAATEAKLPPVRPGFVRLYRSESPTLGFNDVFDKSKIPDFNEGKGRPEGQSYTDDLGTADYYRVSYGPDAKTTYIDVPESTARAAKLNPGEYVLKNPTVPSSELANAVRMAEGKIEGSSENLKIFRDILSKHPEDDPDFVEYQGADIPKGHALYDVLKNQGAMGSDKPATFSDLQGYYTELGDKISSGKLPGDVYQAMKSLHESIGKIMQKMADDHKVGPQLKDAQSYYANYMRTFRDPNSPLYKAIKATERGKSIAALAGKDQTGIEALAKYNPELAARANTIRGYQAEAKLIPVKPKTTKPLPELPEKPIPVTATPKTISAEDIRAAKSEGLQDRADFIKKRGGQIAATFGVYRMLESIIHGNVAQLPSDFAGAVVGYGATQAIGKLLEVPAVRDFLTKPTERDLAQVPPSMRGDMSQIVQIAKAQGIKVDPKLSALLGVAVTPKGPKTQKLQQARDHARFAHVAVGPDGHRIGSNDGETWVDTETGEPVHAQ